MDEEQPSWLNEGSNSSSSAPARNSTAPKKVGGFFSKSSTSSTSETTATSASVPPPVQSSSRSSDGPDPPYKWLVRIVFLSVNIGLSILMAYTGAMGMKESTNVNDTGVVFVGIYMIVFAAILLSYECAQICPIQVLDTLMKKNFGFLYGTFGKGAYMLFMGILAFGLTVPRSLAIGTGIAVAFWGTFQILLFLWRPLYFDKKEKYIP